MELLMCGGLLVGMVVGLPLCWVGGLFNPIGYMGVLPWRVPPEARVRRNRR